VEQATRCVPLPNRASLFALVNYGGELSIAAAAMLVKDKVFGATNLICDPEVTRSPLLSSMRAQWGSLRG
jgi:hypothetical protein